MKRSRWENSDTVYGDRKYYPCYIYDLNENLKEFRRQEMTIGGVLYLDYRQLDERQLDDWFLGYIDFLLKYHLGKK